MKTSRVAFQPIKLEQHLARKYAKLRLDSPDMPPNECYALAGFPVKGLDAEEIENGVVALERSPEVQMAFLNKLYRDGKLAKKWTKDEIISRIQQIADNAHDASYCEIITPEGDVEVKQDAQAAAVALKAYEMLTKINGYDVVTNSDDIVIGIDETLKRYAR